MQRKNTRASAFCIARCLGGADAKGCPASSPQFKSSLQRRVGSRRAGPHLKQPGEVRVTLTLKVEGKVSAGPKAGRGKRRQARTFSPAVTFSCLQQQQQQQLASRWQDSAHHGGDPLGFPFLSPRAPYSARRLFPPSSSPRSRPLRRAPRAAAQGVPGVVVRSAGRLLFKHPRRDSISQSAARGAGRSRKCACPPEEKPAPPSSLGPAILWEEQKQALCGSGAARCNP